MKQENPAMRLESPRFSGGGRIRGRDALLQRLTANEWLRPGQVAVVLGVSRKTVYNMLEDGRIGWRRKPGSKHRICSPTDVQRLIEEASEVHYGSGHQQHPHDRNPTSTTEASPEV